MQVGSVRSIYGVSPVPLSTDYGWVQQAEACQILANPAICQNHLVYPQSLLNAGAL